MRLSCNDFKIWKLVKSNCKLYIFTCFLIVFYVNIWISLFIKLCNLYFLRNTLKKILELLLRRSAHKPTSFSPFSISRVYWVFIFLFVRSKLLVLTYFDPTFISSFAHIEFIVTTLWLQQKLSGSFSKPKIENQTYMQDSTQLSMLVFMLFKYKGRTLFHYKYANVYKKYTHSKEAQVTFLRILFFMLVVILFSSFFLII